MSKAASSELPPIHITKEIHEELKKNLYQLSHILKDNPEFASTLVKNLLLIGKDGEDGEPVFSNSIDKMIYKEYPRIDFEENTPKLRYIAYDLACLIFGDHELTRKARMGYPIEEDDKYQDMLRVEVEQDVRSIFFSSEKSEVGIMGEAISHLDISNE